MGSEQGLLAPLGCSQPELAFFAADSIRLLQTVIEFLHDCALAA
jgi:hypothetical protein